MTPPKLHRLQQQVYHALPVWLQNEAITWWGHWIKRQRYGPVFRRRLEWLNTTEAAGEAEISAYQDAQVRRVVADAYAHVPYYHRIMNERRLRPSDVSSVADLVKLPILPKRVVREAPGEFLHSHMSRREMVVSHTSGTTGSPLAVRLTREALQFQWAVWWRHRARFGLKLGDPFLMFGARLPLPASVDHPPYWRVNRAINQTFLSTYHLTDRTMPTIVEWLKSTNFRFFTGYPSAMYVLANYMRDHGASLPSPPAFVVSGSDALLPGFEDTIAQVFQAPVTDQYGSAEACGNFARCERGRYHLDWEFCAVELLPCGGDNPQRRRMVFTGFANAAMPFIRYDIGDTGHVSLGRCLCGRSSISLDRIEGRVEDYVRTPDGRMAIGMNQVFEWAPGIREAQIVQHSIAAIIVRIVPASGFSKDTIPTLDYELRQRLGDRLRIDFETVDTIERTPAGKFRAVISTLPPVTAEEMEHRRAVAG